MLFPLKGSAELKCDKTSKKGKICFFNDLFYIIKSQTCTWTKKMHVYGICAQGHPLLLSNGIAIHQPERPNRSWVQIK